MILRDIYLELSEIFDFRYEKNLNGSYRVNTVIACVVYPELYTNEDFTEKDIGYFLKHSDFTYQHYPNIRNSFSELMNPKDGSTRFPVAEFADRIDIKCMYSYYRELITGLSTEHLEQLNNFIDNTLESESVLHSRLRLFCSEKHEFLTWIIISSMFNRNIFEDKINGYIESVQDTTDIFAPEDLTGHEQSLSLQRNLRRVNILTASLIISVCLQFILVFAPHLRRQAADISYYFFVLLYSFITIGIWISHGLATYKLTNLRTHFHFSNSYPDFDEDSLKTNLKTKPHNSFLEKKRSRFRCIYFTVCLLLCMLSLIPALIVNSFPFFAGVVLIFILIYLCAERTVAGYNYRTFYDGLTTNAKPNPYRGMAKIYKWEYEKTKFNFKDKYYKNNVPVHSSECYKNIFYLAYDRNKWALINLYLLIVYTNIYVLVIASLSGIITDKSVFFRLPEGMDINLLIMIYISTIGVFCIVSTLCNRSYFTAASVALFSLARIRQNPADAVKLYLSMQSDNIIKEVDVARGIYVYNISRFEQNELIENIFPESDRMLYYHQGVTYRYALRMTYWFVYAITIALLVWHMQNFTWFIPVTLIILSAYLLSKWLVIDRIHYRRLIKEIKKLSSSKEE